MDAALGKAVEHLLDDLRDLRRLLEARTHEVHHLRFQVLQMRKSKSAIPERRIKMLAPFGPCNPVRSLRQCFGCSRDLDGE